MISFSDRLKKHLQIKTGMTYEEIVESDWSQIDKNIEEKTGKKLINRSIGNGLLYSRGTPFIPLEKTISLEKVEKEYKIKRKKRW